MRQLFVKSGGNSRPHFGGGSLCEGDHEKVGNFIHVLGVGKLFYDPVNKGGRLARAGGGGHEQRALSVDGLLLIFGRFKLTAHQARLPVK